ncbi:hypothetical protein F9K80_13235 [Brucella intermedia]|nr:hypothetical protein F9K80_13235 [Brucella intermedia]MPR60375.1 hypothetical protein [Brucella intermedia]
MTILREMFMELLLAFNPFPCNRKIRARNPGRKAPSSSPPTGPSARSAITTKKSGQFGAVRTSSEPGMNGTEGKRRFPQSAPPLPHAKISRCNMTFSMHIYPYHRPRLLCNL